MANVSVNRMRFWKDGMEKHYIQLGTVMTEEAFRNRGLIRGLMEFVEADFGEQTDGMFLFANDTVLTFYPKFGFRPAGETKYEKLVSQETEKSAELYPVYGKEARKKLENAVERSTCQGRFGMIKNVGLTMFYLTKFMQEQVYYLPGENAYAVAELEGGELFLHDVIADRNVDLDAVIQAFGKEISRVTLGFTPSDAEGYEKKAWKEEDTTLFVKGKEWDAFEAWEVMFPTLSHA